MFRESALPSHLSRSNKDESRAAESSKETTPGGERKVRWQVVATARGPVDAAIICGRLETEGIPARVQQEPAGAAIGLTVGLLGQVKVLVPEPLVARALEILNQPPGGETDAEEAGE